MFKTNVEITLVEWPLSTWQNLLLNLTIVERIAMYSYEFLFIHCHCGPTKYHIHNFGKTFFKSIHVTVRQAAYNLRSVLNHLFTHTSKTFSGSSTQFSCCFRIYQFVKSSDEHQFPPSPNSTTYITGVVLLYVVFHH